MDASHVANVATLAASDAVAVTTTDLIAIFRRAFSLVTIFDWSLVYKAFSIVFILSTFYYHGINSTTKEFRTSYPRLYRKLDIKYYNRVKWSFCLIPFADFYFFFLLIWHRYNTVSFLKAFAIKQSR